jgi:hypothetical protein
VGWGKNSEGTFFSKSFGHSLDIFTAATKIEKSSFASAISTIVLSLSRLLNTLMLEALGIVTAPKSRIDARINFMMELILILSTTEDNSKWSSESG